MLRKQLRNVIASEKQKVIEEEKQYQAEGIEEISKNKNELQGYLKNNESFFGGKLNATQRKDLYNYITKGNFLDDVYSSHENVTNAAFLWKYRNKIFSMLKTEGVEKGKASIINKITSPDLGKRGTQKRELKSGTFDPKAFLAK